MTSITSVPNDKGDNEMIPGAVHRSPGIYHTAEENPRKPQLGDCLMKGLCEQTVNVLYVYYIFKINMVSYS